MNHSLKVQKCKRNMSWQCAGVTIILVIVASATSSLLQKKQPHVIMMMVDDLGWNGFALHGNNNEVKNPTMEKLAQEGVLLLNCCVYKFCSPSRAAFLTGRVPGHGIWEVNPNDLAEVGVNLKATMLPAMLKRAGYKTHQIGKWHQGFHAPHFTPRGRGFDTSFGFLMGGADHFNQCHGCVTSVPFPDYTNHSQTCPAVPNECNVSCPEQGRIDLF